MTVDVVLGIVGWAAGGAASLTAFFIWLLKASILKRLEAGIEEIRTQNAEGLENLKSGLRRVERLETDLFQLRSAGYGQIWQLTGALNLFGSECHADCVQLSDRLKDWYFEHGHVLKDESKSRGEGRALVHCIDNWKTNALSNRDQEQSANRNWVVLQFLLSMLRSQLIVELGTRHPPTVRE